MILVRWNHKPHWHRGVILHLLLLCLWHAALTDACQVQFHDRIKRLMTNMAKASQNLWTSLLHLSCNYVFVCLVQSKTKNISQSSESLVSQTKIHLTLNKLSVCFSFKQFTFFFCRIFLMSVFFLLSLHSLMLLLFQGEVKVEEPGSCCPICKKQFSGLYNSAKIIDISLIL